MKEREEKKRKKTGLEGGKKEGREGGRERNKEGRERSWRQEVRGEKALKENLA